ncbi:MAG: hypothetical protein SFU86_20170 [Pirellulaceae bacterium]|nr:hypothetical protein [Pirellulaceae bacterium]
MAAWFRVLNLGAAIMVARYKLFRSSYESWDTLCQQVTTFLTELGPERVIGVSQSHENTLGIFTVWYWDWEGENSPPAAA